MQKISLHDPLLLTASVLAYPWPGHGIRVTVCIEPCSIFFSLPRNLGVISAWQHSTWRAISSRFQNLLAQTSKQRPAIVGPLAA